MTASDVIVRLGENIIRRVELVFGFILIAILQLRGSQRILLKDEAAVIATRNVHVVNLDAATDQISERQNFFRLDLVAANAAGLYQIFVSQNNFLP